MKQRLFIGFALAAIMVICGGIVYHHIFSNEELSSKVEWSIVQAVESQYHDRSSDKIEIVKMDDYTLVGISVHDARKKIWIMLNPRNSPYYKQLPQGTYHLSKEDLKTILASGAVISTVENCLESHIEDPK